jgi:sarcosine oxidase
MPPLGAGIVSPARSIALFGRMIKSGSGADFDVVVCGLGAIGCATVHNLAHRGKRVLGLERYAPGNDRGSSHGATRIIRLGYYEHPSYVPLVRRAYALWRELEDASGRALLHRTGIVEIGSPDSVLVRGTLASARLHELPHQTLPASELMERYPAFALPAHYLGVYQPDGGWLAVDAAFAAWVALAEAAGGQLQNGEFVQSLEQRADAVRVSTSRRMVHAEIAIVATGAWTGSLLPAAALPLRVTREVMAWFAPHDPASCASDRLPVFMLETPHGLHYGIPPQPQNAATGIKVAKHAIRASIPTVTTGLSPRPTRN